MSELTIELDRLIQKAALDGALTEDAVAQFHAIFKKCDAQAEKIAELDQALADVKKEREQVNASFAQTSSKLSDYQTRERELEEREKKITELEIRKECADDRVKDHKEMFTTVFRNSVLRKEVMTPLPGLKQDQYGTSHAPYAQKDSVEEKEE